MGNIIHIFVIFIGILLAWYTKNMFYPIFSVCQQPKSTKNIKICDSMVNFISDGKVVEYNY